MVRVIVPTCSFLGVLAVAADADLDGKQAWSRISQID